MAKTIHLKLTGEAEKLLKTLTSEGLTERDIFSKALGILSEVNQGRVARLQKQYNIEEGIEYIYVLSSPWVTAKMDFLGSK